MDMNQLVELLLGFLVLFLVFRDSEESQPYSWASHVCSRRTYEVGYTSYRTYRTRYRDYYTKCGLWDWGRCKRTRSWRSYYYASRTKSVRRTYYYCCSGWRQSGRYCSIPICSSGCGHGRCISAHTCSCNRGWKGSRCQYDVNECSRSLGGCSQVCINTPGSYRCRCRKGYVLNGRSSCKDKDECATNNGQCDHMCKNTHGSYKCRCLLGYKLLSDGRRCIASNEVDFPVSLVPTPTVTYSNNSSSRVAMVCSFDFPAWNNVSYLVQWYANSINPVKNDTWCIPEEGERTSNHSNCTRRQSVIAPFRHFVIGDTVWCKLYMKFSTSSKNNWTENGTMSNHFYIGIEVSPRHVIKECNLLQEVNVMVTLRPTIPIPNVDWADSVNVYAVKPKKLTRRVFVDKCSVNLKTEDITHGKTIYISDICHFETRNTNGTLVFHFETQTIVPIWFSADYRMPTVQVTLILNDSRHDVCSSSPELSTFDGRRLNLNAVGDFVLYRNKAKNTQVQIRLWICASRAFCVCGVAIREGKDVIVLSICDDLLHQKTAPITILRSPGPLSRGVHIFRTRRNGEFMIILKSGSQIKVQRRTERLNVFVNTPGTDKGKVDGICGNFNDDSTDDFSQGGNGTAHTTGITFVESWKMNKDKSLFKGRLKKERNTNAGFCQRGYT